MQEISVKEAATLLGGCSQQHVYRLYCRGDLDGYRDGKRYVIFAESIDAYKQRNRNPAFAKQQRQPAHGKAPANRKRKAGARGRGARPGGLTELAVPETWDSDWRPGE